MIKDLQILYYETRKIWDHRHVYRHCDKKASIGTTWKQSFIVTSQLLAARSRIDDVKIGQQLFILKSSGAVTEQMWIYIS